MEFDFYMTNIKTSLVRVLPFVFTDVFLDRIHVLFERKMKMLCVTNTQIMKF